MNSWMKLLTVIFIIFKRASVVCTLKLKSPAEQIIPELDIIRSRVDFVTHFVSPLQSFCVTTARHTAYRVAIAHPRSVIRAYCRCWLVLSFLMRLLRGLFGLQLCNVCVKQLKNSKKVMNITTSHRLIFPMSACPKINASRWHSISSFQF